MERFELQRYLELLETGKRYAELMNKYRCAIMEIETKLNVLNAEFSLQYDRNPFETIKSRLKSPASIIKKLERKDQLSDEESFAKSIEDNLYDVAGVEKSLSIAETYPEEWNADFMNYHTLDGAESSANSTNYVNYQRYFELKTEVYLKKGDSVKFGKKTTKPQYGQLVIGDISVVAHPGEFEPEVQPE